MVVLRFHAQPPLGFPRTPLGDLPNMIRLGVHPGSPVRLGILQRTPDTDPREQARRKLTGGEVDRRLERIARGSREFRASVPELRFEPFEPHFTVDSALGGVRDLTPYLTPYGADAGAISGRGWIRNSRISQEERRSGRIRTWLDGPECDS